MIKKIGFQSLYIVNQQLMDTVTTYDPKMKHHITAYVQTHSLNAD